MAGRCCLRRCGSAFARARSGECTCGVVTPAQDALRVRIREGAFREPDLVLVRDAHDTRRRNRFCRGTDLAVEIVSPDNPKRDLVDKRRDYAEAGIPEYWIVDPRNETVTVLALQGAAYVEHGVLARGARADSILLDGLTVDVGAVFDAAD